MFRYIEKQSINTLYKKGTWNKSSPEVIIVIPAYNEEFTVLSNTLSSLATNKVDFHFETYLFINYKKSDTLEVKASSHDLYEQLCELNKTKYTSINLSIFIEELTQKKAGVGLARKYLMDCAIHRLHDSDREAIIINLDADTLVSNNYLKQTKAYFDQHLNMQAASIGFEHPIPELEIKQRAAITQYELHLRYFINMQRLLNLPYAFQTVGSAMAVRSDAYVKMGGMNTKQAGEDFYFLHKFSKTWKLGEINQTLVFPSARTSDRVPFGTGKAIADFIHSDNDIRSTYNPQSFLAIKKWLAYSFRILCAKESVDAKSIIQDPIISIIGKSDFINKIEEIRNNSNDELSLVKRFFQWFDAFRLFKILHGLRDNNFPDLPLNTACKFLFEQLELSDRSNNYENLVLLRKYDLESKYQFQWRADLISSLSNASAS